jgi:hypothetical protein
VSNGDIQRAEQPFISDRLTSTVFLEAARRVVRLFPEGLLVRNRVGNLSVLDTDGEYVGWVDLTTGEVKQVPTEDEGRDDR